MNIAVGDGLVLTVLSGMALAAGFAGSAMPSAFRSVDDAGRETAPTRFWVIAGLYVALACFGIALAVGNWNA